MWFSQLHADGHKQHEPKSTIRVSKFEILWKINFFFFISKILWKMNKCTRKEEQERLTWFGSNGIHPQHKKSKRLHLSHSI